MTTTPPPDTRTKIPHLVMALLFLGLAACWALVVVGALTPGALPYAAPALLVVAGLVGLVAVARGSRGDRGDRRDHPVGTMEDPHDDPHDDLHDESYDPYDAPDVEHTAPLHRPEDLR